MKRLQLTKAERQTLHAMGVSHSSERTRMRAQAVVWLSQGWTLQQTADAFMVHLNSVEHWKQRWNKFGLVGLLEGRHTGRPKKWSSPQRDVLRELALVEGGTASGLLRKMQLRESPVMVSESTARRYLKKMHFSYKRCRYSLKKSAMTLTSNAPAG